MVHILRKKSFYLVFNEKQLNMLCTVGVHGSITMHINKCIYYKLKLLLTKNVGDCDILFSCILCFNHSKFSFS